MLCISSGERPQKREEGNMKMNNMDKGFLMVQESALNGIKERCSPEQYPEGLKLTLNMFLFEGIDEFMKFLSKEDRKMVLDLASKNKLKISKKLNNYIQDYWTNYEPEKDVA
jgi:hypothetical protein